MARDELVRAVGERYRYGSSDTKVRVLDEFVAVTGYHRKHAIRMLNSAHAGQGAPTPRLRPRLYDEAVREALVVLWEASDRSCGKRLKPILPLLVPALERHGHLKLHEAVRARILAVSASSIDRLLSGPRAAQGGRRRRRSNALPLLRSAVPIRTFADWKSPAPGFMEMDLVAHSGESASGSFTKTLVLTDICTGWTECVALAVKDSQLIVEALWALHRSMPFPLLGIDSDNGSEFINALVVDYCAQEKIEFARSRPYRKNDQAWVEQKNGSVVRRLVEYRRLEGLAAAHALARLYAASRLFVDFFQPSFKLAEKRRVGARVHKRYHSPETPAARLLASEAVPEPVKQKLRAVTITLDPLRLLDEIREVQHHLAALAAGDCTQMLPRRNPDLEDFLKGLAVAGKGGEVRPTYQAQLKAKRDWRTRKDPFEAVWPAVILWLITEPDRTAQELLGRLQVEHPGTFAFGQVRTLQRRVQDWRRAAARKMVFSPGEGLAHVSEQLSTPALHSPVTFRA